MYFRNSVFPTDVKQFLKNRVFIYIYKLLFQISLFKLLFVKSFKNIELIQKPSFSYEDTSTCSANVSS